MPKFQNLLGIITSVLVLAFSMPVIAEEKKEAPLPPIKKDQQRIQYDVYAGGLHALKANLDLDLSDKTRYSAELTAKTYGLLGTLAPWHGTFESHGWKGKINKPELHKSTATWRDELEVKEYMYGRDGSFKEYRVTDEHSDRELRKVDDELTQGTSDVLTGALNTMQIIGAGNNCEGETEIFDGKRRYKMIFRHKEDVELEASRWNVYAGPATQCTIEVQPGAGKWYEKPRGWMSIQEQGRERGTMPTVWFANMVEGQPAVPVKIRVKTSYGTLFMHMTDYQATGKKLALED